MYATFAVNRFNGLLLALVLLVMQTSFAAKAPRPTQIIEPANCVTSECHSEIKAYQFLHGPVAGDECAGCHTQTNAQAHTFELWRQKEELCTYCHKFDTGMLPVIHSPVITGECLGCHNPHGGTDRALVREATMAETCGGCHESVTYGKDFLHDPTAKGECTSCHRPHASKYPKLLDVVGTELCLSCHDDFATQMSSVAFTHKALDEGCMKCHDVHGSDHPKAVTDSITGLCLSCHESIRQNTQSAYQHPSVTDERACLTCHTSHGGDLASLMRDSPLRLCMDCHEKTADHSGPERITAMIRMNDPSRFQHTPVREGQCGGCHTIHGGDLPMLLHEVYSAEFRQRFAAEDFKLCFECHDQRLVTDPATCDATNFRNGDDNLHFKHVAADESISHNCRVCHGVHTSKNAALVRDVVPYGNWPMAIRFDKTMTGGTCMTGCHAALAYDRETPLESSPLVAFIRPPAGVPRADNQQPVIAAISTADIHGNLIAVPDYDVPSVLLFLRAEQAQSQQILKLMGAAGFSADTSVIVVFSGEGAAEGATAFAATNPRPWPAIADPNYNLSGSLGVQVWPATLVVQNDGVVLAHTGGAPPSLTKEVQAWLDYASARINRDTLKNRLAQHQLLADGPDKRAAWHLQMGRKLLGESKPAEARATLAEGLKVQPDSIELQIEMIRALVELKEAGQANVILKQLPAEAMPEWERDLLRGRTLAISGQWNEVKRLATEVLRQMPNQGDAFYLIGMVHENERDWEKAAEAYRAAYLNGGR